MPFIASFFSIRLLLVTFFFSVVFALQAQDVQLSQYHYSPSLTNPAMITANPKTNILFNYRHQPLPDGQSFSTGMLSAMYPFLYNKAGVHRAGIGLTLLSDGAGNLLKTNGAMLALGYHLSIGRSFLSAGLQGGLFQRSLDYSGQTTDDQYNGNGGFTPGLGNEPLGNFNQGYALLSTGLYWNWPDEKGGQQAFLGVSAFNLNQPSLSLLGASNDRIPRHITVMGGWQVWSNGVLSLMPTFRAINRAGITQANLGTWLRYRSRSNQPQWKDGTISLGAWYHTAHTVIASLEWEHPHYTVAFSYDMPAAANPGSGQIRGALEMTLGIKLARSPKNSRPPASATPEPVGPVAKILEALPVPPAMTHQTKGGLPAADTLLIPSKAVAPVSLLKQSDFSSIPLSSGVVPFNRGGTQLNTESKVFLDSVAILLLEHPDWSVELVGHSCDIGPTYLNQNISEARAKTVKGYLMKKGISTLQIDARGVGFRQPLVANDTEEGRIINRRVEVTIKQ